MKTCLNYAILLWIFLTGSVSSNAQSSYLMDIKCPVDGHEFKIHSQTNVKPLKTLNDFQKTGEMNHYYEYVINSCPICHYSGYQKDFDTSYNQETKNDLLLLLMPFQSTKMNDITEIEITANIYQYLRKTNYDISHLYLEGSYILKNDPTQVKKRKAFQLLCFESLKYAIENKEYKSGELATCYYLMGELCRRVGDFENAVWYYDISLKEPEKEARISDLAAKQKKLAEKNDDNNLG